MLVSGWLCQAFDQYTEDGTSLCYCHDGTAKDLVKKTVVLSTSQAFYGKTSVNASNSKTLKFGLKSVLLLAYVVRDTAVQNF